MRDLHMTKRLARTGARRMTPLVLAWVIALVVASLPFVAYAGTITVDGTTCTLPDAITAANTDTATGGCTAGSDDDTLLLGGLTHSLATGPYDHDGMTATPSVTTKIVISGGVSGAIVERTGAAKYRLFHVGASGDLALQNVTVRYGDIRSEGGGGGVRNDGALVVIDSTFFANTAVSGGGIFNLGGTVTLTNADIISNTAVVQGGGFANFSNSTVTLTNADIISNTAGVQGGGFANFSNSTVTLTNSDIIANTAGDSGGGFVNFSTVTLTNTDIIANTALYGNYGGFYNGGTATLTDSNIVSNTALYGDGGGFANTNIVLLTRSDVVSNTASGWGGGFFNSSGQVTLINSDIVSNRSNNGIGGGFFNGGTVALTDSNIVSNTAPNGDGGGIANYETVALTRSDVVSNTAGKWGGGFYSDGGTATFSQVQMMNNEAATSGGGFYSEGGTATLSQVRMMNNEAATSGGALYQFGGSITIRQSCITNNSDTAVVYEGGNPIDAAYNWWGGVGGPGGVGPGTGDSVSNNVNFAPFLDAASTDCVLAFDKQTSATDDLLPGQPLTYTLILVNFGGDTLTDITVTDNLPDAFDLGTTVTDPPSINFINGSFEIPELLPSQVATITLVGQIDGAINSEQVLSNIATLNQAVIGELTATASNNAVVPTLGWAQDEYVGNEGSGNVMATVTLSPANPYATTTVQVVITDSTAALAVASMQEVTFPPGSVSESAVIADLDDDQILTRTVELLLTSPSGAKVGDAANATLVFTENDVASLAVTKHVNTSQASVGETITYTYRVTNTGNVTLTTISAEDDKLGIVAGLAGQLAPNATRSATLTYVVQESDLPGPLTNTVTVTGTDSLATEVTDSANVSVSLVSIEEEQGALYLPRLHCAVADCAGPNQ